MGDASAAEGDVIAEEKEAAEGEALLLPGLHSPADSLTVVTCNVL